jgi:ribosomal protein L4
MTLRLRASVISGPLSGGEAPTRKYWKDVNRKQERGWFTSMVESEFQSQECHHVKNVHFKVSG